MSEGGEIPNVLVTPKVVVNASDPYFLHGSDNPGDILVTKPLNGDNNSTWCRSMTIALGAKNKIGFIDSTIQEPSKGDKNFTYWQRCNDMVLS